METFAVTVLLGLAVLPVVDALVDLAPGLTRRDGIVTIALAVAGVFALDYSLFEGFGVDLREAWIGTLLTGLAVVLYTAFATRLAWPWYAFVGSLTTLAAGAALASLERRTEKPA
jgi:hypothetical protein